MEYKYLKIDNIVIPGIRFKEIEKDWIEAPESNGKVENMTKGSNMNWKNISLFLFGYTIIWMILIIIFGR